MAYTIPQPNQSVSGAIQLAGSSPSSIVTVERVDGILSGSALGIVTETVLFGETTAGGGGNYVAVKVNPSGTLQTEAEVQGSVVALQGAPWRVSVISSNPSSMLVGASIIGLTPVTISGTPNVNVSGSVAAWLNSSNASVITVGSPVANQSVSGTVGASVLGHAPVVIVGGSIAASFTPPANQSVSGTLQTDVRGSIAAVIIGGSIATATTNSSVMLLNSANVIGSVTALQGTNPWAISGNTGQTGTRVSSLVSTVPSSVIVGTSIFGQLPAGTAMLGSVATYQGVVPWIVNFQNSSVIAINAGSVITINPGSIITVFQAPSIVGTYAEDALHTTGDRGLLHLAVRNDPGSVLAGATNEYIPISTNDVGELRVTSGNSFIPSVYAVLSSITTVSVMNANQNRKGGTIYNNAGTTVLIKLGTAATTSVYTVKMVDQSYYELPFGYVGVVAGISASNAGILTVTEIT